MRQEKNSIPSNGNLPDCVRPWRLSSFALIAVSVLCLLSCRTARTIPLGEITDSLRIVSSAEAEVQSVIEPARLDTAAELQITQAQIDSLPAGAEYSVQTPQARASLRKRPNGGVALSAQGISPAKVTTTTKARSEADASGADSYKPPEVHLNTAKETAKWYQDGFVIGTLLFAFLSITAIIWAGRKNQV